MLVERLIAHAVALKDHVAVRSITDRELTYGELPLCFSAIRDWLLDRGIEAGDHVGIAMSNGPDLAIALLGTAMHATVTPMDPAQVPLEWSSVLRHVGAKALITDTTHEQVARSVGRSLSIPVHVIPFLHEGQLGRLAGVDPPMKGIATPPDDHMLLMHRTSGTTGTSKRVPLRMVNIAAQARNTAESLLLSPEDRILQVMPLFHMHGFGCLTGTLWSGGTVVCTPGHDGRKYPELCRSFRPTWFSASPAILQDMARVHAKHPDLKVVSPFRFVRSLSAAISTPLIEEIEKVTGAPLVEQYGLTEALSPVIANRPLDGERKRGAIGKPFRTEVRIVDGNGKDVAGGSTGEIVLRGTGVIPAYAENDEINARSWFGEWFRTGDLGSIDEDGFVHLTGRLKEEINRGGEKIDPLEVETALVGHPGVRAAAAFAVPHPTLGEDVAIAYVPSGERIPSNDLRNWMQERISLHKVPKVFHALEALPVTATGKLKRVELARTLQLSLNGSVAHDHSLDSTEGYEHATDRAPVLAKPEQEDRAPDLLPATYVERTIAMVWGQELRRDRIYLDDDFFQIGGDSLSGVRTCARISEMLEAKVDLALLFRRPSLREFAGSLTSSDRVDHWLNLTPIRLSGPLAPFVCVHGDEGNYNLPRLFSDDRPFIGFMHQGEDGMGMRYKTIRSMARHYVNELLEARPEGPYILSGFSTGGILAFEMAQRLIAMGKKVPLLVMLDTRGPTFNWWRYSPRTKLADLRGEYLRPRCERYLRKGVPIPFDLRNFYIINTYRKAVERYRPKPYAGEVLYIRSAQRAEEPMGWEDLLTGPVHVEVVEGKHLSIIREPHVAELAAVLEKFMEDKGI